MLRRSVFLVVASFLTLCPSRCFVHAQGSAELAVALDPPKPLIEHRDARQFLNFDLVITNHGQSTLRLTEIEMSVFDSTGVLVLRKTVNSNGLAPAIDIVAKQMLTPGESQDIFNPFYSFATEVPIHHMEYSFRYRRENNVQQRERNLHRLPMDYDVEMRAPVIPSDYQPKTDLILPLKGRLLAWDGHDFYSHHRRIPLTAPTVRKMGIRANPNRYGVDLVVVDDQGRMYHDDAFDKKNWYTYGAAIYAPAGGKIIAPANNIPDNEFHGKQIDSPEPPPGTNPDLGNYVIIDQGNGEFSVFPHMMPGSVSVKAGDAVRQGDFLGRVGFSGDAVFPHVHYSLLSGPNVYEFEGVPAYFTRFRRLLGRKAPDEQRGTVDSGDLVESTANYKGASSGQQ